MGSLKEDLARKMCRLILLLAFVVIIGPGCGTQELPADFDPFIFANSSFANLDGACPSGIKRCECLNSPGTFTNGPFDPNKHPIDALITYVGCNPGYCYCKNDPETEIDARPQFFSAVLDLCPMGEINRCLCQDGKTKAKPPIDILKVNSCRPKKCKCNGSKKVETNKSYGCKKGGIPDCSKENDLFCKDGTPINANTVMRYWVTGVRQRWGSSDGSFKPCACPDGSHPKCKSTGRWTQCPNGDPVDFSLGVWEQFAGCRVEDW